MTSSDSPAAILAIRPAFAEDAAAVTRLAALDSAAIPTGALLLGVLDGRPLAAVSVDTGAVIADPFSPTADLVALLQQRVGHLRAAHAPPARHRALGAITGRLRRSPRASSVA